MTKDHTDLINRIITHLKAGGMVQITTHLKSTVFDSRHADMFKVGKDGSPLVQRGKNWDDIRWCGIRFSKLPEVMK